MHVERWGVAGPAAPRALLVHGLSSSGETMWELGEGLAGAGWSVVAPDLPGHGSSADAASYLLADLADDVAELGGGFDLYVGHSLGGSIGTSLLARYPTTARRAVLIDPVITAPDDSRDGVAAEFHADLARLDADVEAAEHPHWHPRTVAARVRSMQAVRPAAVDAILAQNRPWDLRADVARIQVPVHVLAASDDAAFPPEHGALVTAANPAWSWEIVPDTGHSVHRDRPGLVLDRLLTRPS